MKVHTKAIQLKLIIGSLIGFISTAFASNGPSLSCEPGASQTDHCRVSIRHIEGRGIGYDKGYTTFEGFFAPDPDQVDLLPFLDLRGHVFDNGYMAANAGIGLRRVIGHKIHGINAYYDYRNISRDYYNQLGFGFERLEKDLDFRVNAYLPVGRKISLLDNPQFFGFSDHTMVLSQRYQTAMKGVDAELVVHFELLPGLNLSSAIGPYYSFEEINAGTWGGKARLKSELGRYIKFEVSNSYDQMFHNNFQLQMTFTLPLESKPHHAGVNSHKKNYSDILRARFLQPVDRKEIIVIGNKDKKLAAIDPATGKPFYVVFVDNTSHSEGTFESPYPTLALAQENSNIGDIIYIFPGDGTTHGMDRGIILQPNQKIWGSGVEQQIQAAQGSLIIPAHTIYAPQITNVDTDPDGDGITLSSNNQVSGIAIMAATGNGIIGVDPQNVQISTTTIDHSGADQIHLQYGDDPGTMTLNNLTLTNGQVNTVFIHSTGAAVVGVIDNSFFSGNAQGYFVDACFSGEATFSFTNNTVDNNYASLFNFTAPSTLIISDNAFNNSISPSDAPLRINAAESSLSVTIKNNTISNNDTGAISFGLNDTNAANLTIDHNTITNNSSGNMDYLGSAIVLDAMDSSTGNITLVLTDNVISGNSRSAVYNTQGSFNTFQMTATNNEINNNVGGGFVFDNPSNTLTLIATNNVISNGGNHAISTSGNKTMGVVNMTFSNNQITDNTGFSNGVALSHEGTTLNLTLIDNTISNNAGSAVILYSSDTIENLVATLENNTISDNQNLDNLNAAPGIDLEQFTNMSGVITNNTFSNNEGYGVYVYSTETTPSACLNMNGNVSDTGYFLENDDGVFKLAPLNADIVNVGTIEKTGITGVSSCP